MVRTRSLVIVAATLSVAIGAFSAPAAAQLDPRVAFVNGIPGKTVDVCVGNQEVKSRLKYGGWFQRTFSPRARTVRFRTASAGRCQGTVLGVEPVNLVADDDLTLVATKKADKVLLWDNMLVPAPIGPVDWWYSIRHAGDMGNVVFARETDVVVSALPAHFIKGQEDRDTGTNFETFWLAATKHDAAQPMEEEHFMVIEGRRLEIILVGSTTGNARFVAIYRPNVPV